MELSKPVKGEKHVWKNLKNNDKRAAVELWSRKAEENQHTHQDSGSHYS
jgi:hypothetical protein